MASKVVGSEKLFFLNHRSLRKQRSFIASGPNGVSREGRETPFGPGAMKDGCFRRPQPLVLFNNISDSMAGVFSVIILYRNIAALKAQTWQLKVGLGGGVTKSD